MLANSRVLGYCAMSVGEYVRTFRMTVLPSKRRGVYTQRDGATHEMTLIFSCTPVRTWNLAYQFRCCVRKQQRL